jgi:N-acetylmuramoyl-L-alanine amidase
METQVPTPPTRTKNGKNPAHYIQTIIGVAFVLATLYTAFLPNSLLPESLIQRVAQVISPKNTNAPTSAAASPTATPRAKPLIGIVAGHWGNDSGAVCPDGVKEVDVNLDVATRVKEALVGEGYDVDLLKEFDPRLDGYEALLLVSIHSDSCQYVNDQATGFKVSAAMSSKYPEKANRLTACLRGRYEETTGLPFHPGSVTNDMSSYHAFSEIDSSTTAAIIEIGFLNLDYQILTKHPDVIADGVTKGILCFVRNEDVTAQPTPTQIP